MKDLTLAQIERLAIKNREASKKRLKEEQGKSGRSEGVDKPKKTVYVTRSVDPKFEDVDHRSLFREMKKVPYQD